MEVFLEILKYTLPSLIVFFAAYFVLRKMLENEREQQKLEIRKEKSKEFTPLRLQAYERLILFMERVAPTNLVMRTQKKGMSARYLQLELIKTIRTEYEHNITQQLYVSSNTWKVVTSAKEEMLKFVNLAASNMPEDATGEELAKLLIEKTAEVQNLPTTVAVEYIKKEVRRMF